MKGTNHKKRSVAMILAIVAASGVTAAYATTSSVRPEAHVVLTKGPNAINPATCRFLHPEKDVVLNLGTLARKVTANGKYDVAEDARHDAFNACVRNWIRNHQKAGVGVPGPAGPAGPPGPAGAPGGLAGYVQVSAHGTGETVSVSCPKGDVVLGGGAPSETTGSYPSGNGTWTVVRDRMSPVTLTVVATCAAVAS